MATVTARPDLYSQQQVASMLRQERTAIRIAVLTLGLSYKIDPGRSGKLLDRADVETIARALGREIDWEKRPSS